MKIYIYRKACRNYKRVYKKQSIKLCKICKKCM